MEKKQRYCSPETEVIMLTLEMGCMSVDITSVSDPFSGNVEVIW